MKLVSTYPHDATNLLADEIVQFAAFAKDKEDKEVSHIISTGSFIVR